MSHKVKKDEYKRLHRGETFVGFAPKVEPTKKERLEKTAKKTQKTLDKRVLICYNDYSKEKE